MKQPNKLSDKETIQGLKVLDDKALDQIYGNCKEKAIAYIKKKKLSDNEAEEIFQKAVGIFYRKVKKPEFKLTVAICTFLISITNNLILEFYRKSKREVVTSIEDEPLIDEIEAIPILNPYAGRWEFCLEMLKKLGGRCEKILRAFYLKKKSLIEIAKMLNEEEKSENESNEEISVGATKMKKHRCMKEIIELAKADYRYNDFF